jgi:hypothetical protein
MKCSNTQALEAFITATYPTVTPIQHTQEQRQFTFPCGLIMNIYTTGTVNFQGNSGNSHDDRHCERNKYNQRRSLLKKTAQKGGFLSPQNTLIYHNPLIVRTAKTASGRFWQETGKTGNKPPENPPETHQVNFTCMHDYAAR